MDNNHILVKEMISNHATNESFTFSLFHNPRNSVSRNSGYSGDQLATAYEQDSAHYDQHELFDMDINLPFIWGKFHEAKETHSTFVQDNDVAEPVNDNSMIASAYSPGGEDFEFRIALSDHDSCCTDIMGALSPADDLFYKGQLLPLHLPPRRQMVERLSSLESNHTNEEDIDLDAVAMDNGNVGYIPTVAELINEERYSSYSHRGSNLAVDEDELPQLNVLAISRSANSYTYSREYEHDNSVFPECYKDPALQMIQSNLHRYMETRRHSRSSMSCTVLSPSSKSLGFEDVAFWSDNCHGFALGRAKEARRRGSSVLKFRAPASFFKSLFNSRELKGLLVPRNANFHPCRSAQKAKIQEDDDEDEEEAGHFARYHSGHEHGWSIVNNMPVTLTIKEPHERDKILKKAREYIHKYVKLFKSMYVLLSHTHTEQSRNLLESSSSLEYELSTCSSSSSASSSRARQGSSMVYMEQKAAVKNTTLESLRSTSFSKCRRRNSETLNAGLGDCTSERSAVVPSRVIEEGASGNTILHNMGCSSSCVEVENPIQGAIAHCKQSSALPSK